MVNVAVIGSGYWGKNLVRNFHELGALHTICDCNLRTIRDFQKKYPQKTCDTSYDRVLQNPSVNAVAIATPSETHFEFAKRALLANKHVFVEKPLSLMVNEAEQLHRLAADKALKLMVGHILLYHPAILGLKEIIDSGKLGRINYIYSNRLNLGKFRSEENILWSFAPHDISAILYLLEEMPSQVVAQGGDYVNNGIADVTMSLLSFKSGVKGHVFVSWLHPSKEQKLVVVGDKQMAVFDDTLTEGKLQIDDKGVKWLHRRPVPRKNDAQIVPLDLVEPLNAECKHFLDCIESGMTPRTDGNNGVQVLKILNACQESLGKGGATVHLDERDDPGSDLLMFDVSYGSAKSYPTTPRRQAVSELLTKSNLPLSNVIANETAVVDFPCRIGKGTTVGHFTHVMAGAEIGENCHIGQNVIVSPKARIGNNVRIENNVSLDEEVVFQDGVSCGSSVVFTNVVRNSLSTFSETDHGRTTIEEGANIGANATIVCGHTIGRNAFIGAGAVVSSDVPARALMLGNPATQQGWICECRQRLDLGNGSVTCSECGRRYSVDERGLRFDVTQTVSVDRSVAL
jgi:UDP-2-acetamido-3-amino-2,3-dideoxy-glucuronate N-acetyltransferase